MQKWRVKPKKRKRSDKPLILAPAIKSANKDGWRCTSTAGEEARSPYSSLIWSDPVWTNSMYDRSCRNTGWDLSSPSSLRLRGVFGSGSIWLTGNRFIITSLDLLCASIVNLRYKFRCCFSEIAFHDLLLFVWFLCWYILAFVPWL